MPSSATSTQTLRPLPPPVTAMCPPSGVYLMALPRMLVTTCSRRWRSPLISGMSSARVQVRVWLWRRASMALARQTFSTLSRKEKGAKRISVFPASRRLRVRRSWTM